MRALKWTFNCFRVLKVGARDGEAIPSRTKLTKIDAHELNEINLSDRVL